MWASPRDNPRMPKASLPSTDVIFPGLQAPSPETKETEGFTWGLSSCLALFLSSGPRLAEKGTSLILKILRRLEQLPHPPPHTAERKATSPNRIPDTSLLRPSWISTKRPACWDPRPNEESHAVHILAPPASPVLNLCDICLRRGVYAGLEITAEPTRKSNG